MLSWLERGGAGGGPTAHVDSERALICPSCHEPVGESILGGALTRMAHEGRAAIVLPVSVVCGRRLAGGVRCKGRWVAPAWLLVAVARLLAEADAEMAGAGMVPRDARALGEIAEAGVLSLV